MTNVRLLIQLCLTISLGIHKTACLADLFSGRSYCVETSYLICGAYWLTGFFAVGMSTVRVFGAGYKISFFVGLTLSLLDFLRLLLIIVKYSVCLIFFIKCFFSTHDCAFLMSRGLVNFGSRDLEVMFTDLTSWSLRLFLSIPLFIGKSLFLKMPVNLIQYHGAVESFNNRHFACELKYRDLSLRNHYNNNIFAHCFFFP